MDVIVPMRMTVAGPGIFTLVNAHFFEKCGSDFCPVFGRPTPIRRREGEAARPDCLLAIWSELPVQPRLAGHFSGAAGQAAGHPLAAWLAVLAGEVVVQTRPD